MTVRSSFTKDLQDAADSHRALVKGPLGDHIRLTEVLLDLQNQIYTPFLWLINAPALRDWPLSAPSVVSCLRKSEFLAFSALRLTEIGQYGPARTLMRPIFEAALIAKFCSISNDNGVFERWFSGEPISLQRQVFARILAPSTKPLQSLWTDLCELSHATIYSSQIRAEPDPDETQIVGNTVLLNMLIECNYHLISQFIGTRKAEYETKRHSNSYEVPNLRKQIQARFRTARAFMRRPARAVVGTFRSQWRVRSAA